MARGKKEVALGAPKLRAIDLSTKLGPMAPGATISLLECCHCIYLDVMIYYVEPCNLISDIDYGTDL